MDNSSKNGFISLKIKSRLENLLLVRLAVKSIISYVLRDEMDAYQTELCVVEALTNIITHAYGSRQDQDIIVGVTLCRDSIRFTLSDNGMSVESLEKKEPQFDFNDIESAPEGGMGLYIIHTVMDEVTYEPGSKKNTLTMVKYFKPL